MKTAKKVLGAQIRNAKRKNKRLKEKAKNLSTEDLMTLWMAKGGGKQSNSEANASAAPKRKNFILRRHFRDDGCKGGLHCQQCARTYEWRADASGDVTDTRHSAGWIATHLHSCLCVHKSGGVLPCLSEHLGDRIMR